MKHSSMLGALGLQMISKYSSAILQIILAIVLARLLTPEDYGLVAIISVFATLFSVLADTGIGTAVVQYKDLTKEDYRGLFFFTCIIGILLGGIFASLSNVFSLIYKNDELILLCIFIAPAILFNSMNMVPNGLLLKDHFFRIIAIRTVVVTASCGVIAILLAILGFGAYALVANTLLSSLMILVWNWLSSGLGMPSARFIAPVKKVFRYSAFQALFGFSNYFARNLDNMLIGYFMGAAQLGYYDKSYRLMTYPITYLTGIFSSVLQPYLSKISDQREKIYEYWIRISKLLAFVGGFITALFFCCSNEIILIMFGEQWLLAAPALQGLSISVMLQMINSTSGAIFQSTWHTDYLFKCGLINSGISILIITLSCFTHSIVFLSYAVSIAYIMHFLITGFFLPGKVFNKKLYAYLREFFPSITCSFLTICIVIFMEHLFLFIGVNDFFIVSISKFLAVILIYCFFGWSLRQFSLFNVINEMKRMK